MSNFTLSSVMTHRQTDTMCDNGWCCWCCLPGCWLLCGCSRQQLQREGRQKMCAGDGARKGLSDSWSKWVSVDCSRASQLVIAHQDKPFHIWQERHARGHRLSGLGRNGLGGWGAVRVANRSPPVSTQSLRLSTEPVCTEYQRWSILMTRRNRGSVVL